MGVFVILLDARFDDLYELVANGLHGRLIGCGSICALFGLSFRRILRWGGRGRRAQGACTQAE